MRFEFGGFPIVLIGGSFFVGSAPVSGWFKGKKPWTPLILGVPSKAEKPIFLFTGYVPKPNSSLAMDYPWKPGFKAARKARSIKRWSQSRGETGRVVL